MQPVRLGYNPNMKTHTIATLSEGAGLRLVLFAAVAVMFGLALGCGANGSDDDGEPSASDSGAPTPPTVGPSQFLAPPTSIPAPTAVPAAKSAPTPESLDQTPTQTPSAVMREAPTPRVISRPSASKREPAPDFEMNTFDGELLRLSDLRGKVVVLNFWASWCPSCRWEMPFFERIAQEYGDQEVVFVGVAMSDTLEDAEEFAEKVGVTYPLGLDQTNEIVRAYGVRSLPTTFFISKDGTIRRKLTSPANEGVLRVFIRGQLG